MKNDKAILLFSGGQDSTTCLYWALQVFKEVHCLMFDYGQSHVKELDQARKIIALTRAKGYTVTEKTFDIKGLLCSSSLIEKSNHNERSRINNDLPASFTSGRNILFLSIAASYAADNEINDIVTGVCQTDYSGYPDCRRTTIDAMQNVLSLGYGAGDFRIHTPLMYISKAETWKMAKDLSCINIVIDYSLTDYNGSMVKNEWGYGVNDNPATDLRVKGYFEAKKKGWI